MIRTTLIVTVAAFFLSVVCLSAAIAIGGPEAIASGAWAWGPWSHVRNVTWSHTYSSEDSSRREEAWTSDKLLMEIPGDVTFTQADGPGKIVITGPKSVIDHLSLEGGGIHPDHMRQGDNFADLRDADIRVEITAPKVTYFALHGSGKLDIRDYNQDRLGIGVFGSSDVEAHGKARQVELTINGSGDADLGDLATDAATVNISGSGTAKVGPKTSAKLDISGSGDVTLTSHPQHLESHVTGSGSVDQGDDETPATPAEPQPPKAPVKPGKVVKRT
jgi:hypothetical protein